ncbi:hypothetical protein [Paenibacillus sp. P32E]|uniref:hypothetical protein n=1 Tax=Paenibacillus sp. P32E TaxID=1349434 RepID=UPI00093C5318|nr:hypothetical protein [Paenibacillus sp. P32E]OKP84408.1 hypothetical protein A3848_24320 [Paenibacillus sp. P32E]
MIFAKIWQADMESSGVIPLVKGLSDGQKDIHNGYVVVDMNPLSGQYSGEGDDSNEIKVFKEVVIPDGKRLSYDLFMQLHNYYDQSFKQRDPASPKNIKEINEFLEYAAITAPMRLARKYAEDYHHIRAGCSKEEWIDTLRSIWFRASKGDSPSYFEQVFIGEQGGNRRTFGEHHFWYHYCVNNGPVESIRNENSNVLIKHIDVGRSEKSNLAEVITLTYTYEEIRSNGSKKNQVRDLGGFFVGTSAEGLMALGTVAYLDGRAQIPMELNGEAFDLMMYRTEDTAKNPLSFSPRFKTPVHV